MHAVRMMAMHYMHPEWNVYSKVAHLCAAYDRLRECIMHVLHSPTPQTMHHAAYFPRIDNKTSSTGKHI